MHITSVFAISINGMITDENDKVSFVTDASFENYKNALRETGCAIAGRKTYEVVQNAGDLEGLDVTSMVVTTDQQYQPVNTTDLVAHSPAEAVELAAAQGFEKALLIGGGKLHASFMAAGLLDELLLDIEPAAIGQGTPLFDGPAFHAELELLEFHKFSENELQLRYRVVK